MPRSHGVPRPHQMPRLAHLGKRYAQGLLSALLALLSFLAAPATAAHAAPALSLPTPPGETWKVIQGYGCGTHNSWDRYSLDLANVDGRTYGAPVRAAADGQIWSWTAKSGTLILAHGDGFYTMYTHMSRAVTTKLDTAVSRGDVIGYVGDRGAPGTPHLHFTAFTGAGIDAHGRKSMPLSFAEGVDLPDIGGCNQHGGERLTAGGQFRAQSDTVRFRGDAQPQVWYNADRRIEFVLPDGARGLSQSWDQPPGGDTPQFQNADAGFMQLAWAGEGLHTLEVRVWEAGGRQSVVTYGPIGYDVTPPSAVAPLAGPLVSPSQLQWQPASDNGSGVAGYRIYVGGDPNGTSDWFSPSPETPTPALGAGSYFLRVQPLDYAGNAGAWATIGQIVVK